jgi:hypothetical protein
MSELGGPVFEMPAGLADNTAGQSTCPICGRTWTVSVYDDCLVPACGCYGTSTGADNPSRPCESCGLAHAFGCDKMPS